MKYIPLNKYVLLGDIEDSQATDTKVLVPDDYKVVKNFGTYRVVDFSMDCDTYFEPGEEVIVEENMVREVELSKDTKHYVVPENLVILRKNSEAEAD
jgi:hypothetical protein